MVMKRSALLALLLLTWSVSNLQILSVSGDPTITSSNSISSSLRGGKMIYIKAIGHSTNALDNRVLVGLIPCTIPADGVTDTYISCETGDSGSSSDIKNLPITLISSGVPYTTFSYRVNYLYSVTPQIRQIFPSAGFAGSTVNIYGIHRISNLGDGLRDMGDVIGLKLGSDYCSRFDIYQDPINSNNYEYIRCIQSSTQEAGRYNITEHVTVGYGDNSRFMSRSSLDPTDNFQFTVLPTVKKVSPNSGNIGGQYLTISGTGFSSQMKNNTVSVDGNNCHVTAATNEQIKCTLAAKDSGVSSLLQTNATSQNNGYFSGAGIKYERYVISSSISTMSAFVTAIRTGDNAALGTAQEIGFRADIREANVYSYNEAQAWRGYFTAPVTGTYVFRGNADDQFRVYLDHTYGSVDPASLTTPLISSSTVQTFMDYFNKDVPSSQASIELEAGKSYYLEAYHMDTGAGTGFFELAVEVPNADTTAIRQVYQVDKIITDSTVQPEEIIYSLTGSNVPASSKLELSITRINNNLEVTYDKKVNITYGCSASVFESALNNFDNFNPYQTTVTRKIYDSLGNELPDTTGAYKIDYLVSVYRQRPSSKIDQPFDTRVTYDGFNATWSKTSVTTHSPLISGTFQLSIGGVPIVDSLQNPDLRYDISASTLQGYIRNSGIVGFDYVRVSSASAISCGYTCQWTIQFREYNQVVPNVVVNGANLVGGSTTPSITKTSVRSYSPSIDFNPVDYRFLHTYSNSINVEVKTNGLSAVCTGACSYTFNPFTEITSLGYTGSTLQFAISDPTPAGFAASDLTVPVGGFSCTNVAGSIGSLTCNMRTNTDGSATLVAGQITPLVYVNQYGIAGLASGVNPLSIPLNTDSLSSTTGGNNGGYLITLTGSGFPLDVSLIKIQMCQKQATIKTTTNIQVEFYIPACSTLTTEAVTVTVGTLTNSTLSFTYIDGSGTAPQITAINPVSANPGIKGTMIITGSGFGTDASVVTVFLANNTGKIYQLPILSISDTSIKTGLPGGRQGTFTVEVNLPTLGDSVPAINNANIFNYAFTVSSISPVTGSIHGGTLLTITGENFATAAQQTLVYVGWTLNWFCTIQSITTNEIKCRTPAISDKYKTGEPVQVVVSTRLLILNYCSGVCNFTYLTATESPQLTSMSDSTVMISGSSMKTITLTGSNLIDSNNFAEVALTHSITGTVTVITPSSSTATQVVFDVDTNIASGTYYVSVRNELGGTNSKELSIYWTPGSASWASGGSTAGGIATLSNGGNYPASIDGKLFSISLTANGANYPIKIRSCCSGNVIEMELPAAASGTFFTITMAGPVNTATRNYTLSSSLTPTASITSSLTPAPGTSTITFDLTNSVSATITEISLVSTISSTNVISIPANSWTTTGASTSFSADLSSGAYNLRVLTTPNGYVLFDNKLDVQFPSGATTSSGPISFNGGTFTITGSNLSPSSFITVNQLRGDIISYTPSAVQYHVPALVTANSQTTFTLAQEGLIDRSKLAYISDMVPTVNTVQNAFDGSVTSIYSSSNAQCWMGVDAGSGLAIAVSRIRFFPSLTWTNVANKILYSVFEGSNDMTTWTTLATVDQTIHTGWNTLKSSIQTPFRYVRFSHNSTSNCNISEFELYGITYSTSSVSLTSQTSDVVYEDGSNSQTFAGAVEYRQDQTPIVTSVSPRYGNIGGGYILTISGSYLDIASATVTIDGVDCPVQSATASQITCIVGTRSSTYAQDNTFSVTLGNSYALLEDTFLYVLEWSNSTTWGVDMPPIDNDLIYVPKGTTLLVDQSTPILQGIAVEGGTLVFKDGVDLTVQAGFITMNGGKFIAGTEKHPHNSKLTFIMYGGYYGKQQPLFGNKGIGCLNCQFSMYGTPRTVTWTTIAATINTGDSQFTVSEAVDWQVGEQIVVASTSFNHWEAQRRFITAVSGQSITVDSPFVYKHVSVIQTYGSDLLQMRAEVGLLTRNIKMRGDDTSVSKMYGSHLLLTRSQHNNFKGHVAYSQFTHCGQPQIMGRYCIHFHMAGDVPTSYVRGNAVHDSFARVTTIHGVHFLTVEDNVGYRVRGHNFFVEDGIETHNLIKHNLAIGSIAATNMLQTDTSVASFWITNPSNDVVDNHAAGSDFYGIWYQVKPRPDGPSATLDVCPMGNPLGNVSNNVAHSNTRFGLRIFTLAPRLYPCIDTRDDKNPEDPWIHNPSIPATFSNFTLYKNLQDGVLAENVGHVIFDRFIVAENYHGGIEMYLANFTKEAPTILNTTIIGMSTTNAHSDTTNYTKGMAGAITGRSGSFNLSNVRFYSYPAGSYVLKTCRHCDDPLKYTNLGTDVYLKQLTFTNISGRYLQMIGTKRDVIFDTDGSMSSAFDGLSRPTGGTIIHGYNHIKAFHQSTCPSATDAASWDNSIMCDATETVRRVVFTNIINKGTFNAQYMKVTELVSINDTTSENIGSSLYTQVRSLLDGTTMEPKKEKTNAWSLPYLTGNTYNVWWGSGLDFSHIAIFTTPLYNAQDSGIIFKFNYTANRQLFEVGPMRGGAKKLSQLDYLSEEITYLDASACQNGQYFHDNQEGPARMMSICQSGKNRTAYEYTEVNGIICRYLCPAPAGTFVKEKFIRRWSNTSQWPNNVLPQAGDRVEVHGNWTVLLDVDPPALDQLIIDGTLFLDDTRDVNITANWIHIRAGNFSAGSSGNPFLHKLTIQVNGNKADNGYYIDPILAGNKHMVVTGTLELYGPTPSTTISYMTETTMSGSDIIKVASMTDWQVGDTLVIAPSFSYTVQQHETRTISSINNDGTITLNSPLTYTHYGSSSNTISNNYGTLDARTRVGHVNRNIMIVPGPDVNWGFSVTVYGFRDTNNNTWIGNAQLTGVQFLNGGQLDTYNSPLKFLNTFTSTIRSNIKDSSFINCKANCVKIDNAKSITMTGNVLYNVWVIGIQADSVADISISNNVIIGVSGRPSMPEGTDLTACMAVVNYPSPTDKVLVRNNYCQGSTQHGYAFTFVKCNQKELNPFANNTVGSAKIGYILNTNNQQCQLFSYAKAYGCLIGQISGSPGISKIIFDQFIMADNGRGVSLKFGGAGSDLDNTAILQNSYITAISRPNCAQCYQAGAFTCQGMIGSRLLTASNNGQTLPSKFGTGFDTICKAPNSDSKNYFINVTFDNYQQSYTNANLARCSNNFVLTPHSVSHDMVGSAYLYTSKCTNCDSDSYLKAPSPNPSFLGWFGGCGDILCTGRINYVVQDWNGTFFGQKGTIIPNQNNPIALNEGCSAYSTAMNAYMCPTRQDFAVLEYESKAADFQTRIMWPVSLTSDQNGYTTVTNAWREWEWFGNEPQNKRMGRFATTLALNRTYNMTFVSEPPHKLALMLQQRTPDTAGQPENWVQFRLHYPRPNSIRLRLNNQIVDPILLTDINHTTSGLREGLNNSKCGSNAYLYTNYTISFVITQEAGCLVQIELTDSIQLTTHFAMNISDFFLSNNSITNFINNLCALLNIVDTSRVKVVGVHSGSVFVTTVITPSSVTSTTNETTNVTVPEPTLSTISTTLSSMITSGTYGQYMSSNAGLGAVLGASSSYYTLQTVVEASDSNVGLIAGCVVAGIVMVFMSIFIFVYCIRRRSKVSDLAVTDNDEELGQKYDIHNPVVVSELHHSDEKSDNKIFNVKENMEHFD